MVYTSKIFCNFPGVHTRYGGGAGYLILNNILKM